MNIQEMSDEQLENELITSDFHGKEIKNLCLKELLNRAIDKTIRSVHGEIY